MCTYRHSCLNTVLLMSSLGSGQAGCSTQSRPSTSHRCCPHECWSLPAGGPRWSTLEDPPRDSKKAGYSAHKYREQSVPIPWPKSAASKPYWTLAKTPILVSYPSRCLSSRANPDWDRVQPLSTMLVPEPKPISRRYVSTSHTARFRLSLFPTRDVTFHVPVAKLGS